MRRLGVCLLTTSHPVDYSRFLHREASSLARAGYRVTYVALGRAVPTGLPPGVEVIPVRERRGREKPGMLREIGRLARGLPVDVFHCLDPWALRIGLREKRRRGTRLVYDSTESYPEVYRDRDDWPAPARAAAAALVRSLERRATEQADAIIETNETRAKRFLALGRRPVLVPNYPPAGLVTKSQAAREPWIAYTGLVTPRRGFNVLVRALARLPDAGPDLRLKVMGSFEAGTGFQGSMSRLVDRLGVERRVDYLGWQPYEQMFHVLERCMLGVVLLQPERWNDFTGLPNKLFEFMAARLAVVVSDFPEMRDVVRGAGCGWCVEPADVSAVAGVLRNALAEPEEIAKRGEAGRQAVLDRYSWNTAEATLLSVYEELTG